MNVCAGMLLEERNVCLCLVFVSLSPAASHQESCYSQDPHRPTRTSLYSGHLGTLVPGIMVHLVQGTMLHLVLLLSRPHCPPKILQLWTTFCSAWSVVKCPPGWVCAAWCAVDGAMLVVTPDKEEKVQYGSKCIEFWRKEVLQSWLKPPTGSGVLSPQSWSPPQWRGAPRLPRAPTAHLRTDGLPPHWSAQTFQFGRKTIGIFSKFGLRLGRLRRKNPLGEGLKNEEVQKCTKHQLVLLNIFNVLGPQKANNSLTSTILYDCLLLVNPWTSSTKIWSR